MIQAALENLERQAEGVARTLLLPRDSPEAEAVLQLYLTGGGAAKLQAAGNLSARELLGSVVVQRIENQGLYKKYAAIPTAESGSPRVGDQLHVPRYTEAVMWHGARLKQADGESLAAKLQSIAEKGFDPMRCVKGAAPEGGIWVATSPLESFGQGKDGLIAFVLCLTKTHFNEWPDSSCARVLQRERVLPLYSVVHT